MQALQLTHNKTLEWVEVPFPDLETNSDVLVRMKSVGICGSDIHYYKHGRIGSQVVQYPLVLGHEGSGTVVDVGRDVTRFHPGDRVAIDPAMPCFDCDQCRSGRPHTCIHLKFLGMPGQAEGCLSECIVIPETSLYRLPGELDYDAGALSEPLSIGYYAIQQARQSKPDGIGILGYGPIGMSVLRAAQHAGTKHIFVTDKIEQRLRIATQAGATWCGNPLSADIVDEIHKSHPQLLDIVYECCGDQEAVDQAVAILKPGGILMIIGIPECQRWSFNVDALRHKEITIVNVRRQNHCIQDVLDLMATGNLDYKDMITHRFPASDAHEAFNMVAGYLDGVMKAIIQF